MRASRSRRWGPDCSPFGTGSSRWQTRSRRVAGGVGETASSWIAGAAIGIAVVAAIGVVGKKLRQGAQAVGLGWADRIAGGLIGAVEGALVAAVLVVGATWVAGADSPIITESRSVEFLEQVQTYLAEHRPTSSPRGGCAAGLASEALATPLFCRSSAAEEVSWRSPSLSLPPRREDPALPLRWSQGVPPLSASAGVSPFCESSAGVLPGAHLRQALSTGPRLESARPADPARAPLERCGPRSACPRRASPLPGPEPT